MRSLLSGESVAKDRILFDRLVQRPVVHRIDLCTEHHTVDRQSDLAADLGGDQVIVSGEHLHDDTMSRQRFDCGLGRLFRRVEKVDIASQR